MELYEKFALSGFVLTWFAILAPKYLPKPAGATVAWVSLALAFTFTNISIWL